MIARYDGEELNEGGREGLSGLSVTHTRQVQVAPILRATKAKVFARGNRVYSITFSFAREYATLEEAFDTAIQLGENLAASGDLEFEQTGDNAAVQSTFFEDAVLQSITPVPLGKTYILSFAFIAHSRKVIQP